MSEILKLLDKNINNFKLLIDDVYPNESLVIYIFKLKLGDYLKIIGEQFFIEKYIKIYNNIIIDALLDGFEELIEYIEKISFKYFNLTFDYIFNVNYSNTVYESVLIKLLDKKQYNIINCVFNLVKMNISTGTFQCYNSNSKQVVMFTINVVDIFYNFIIFLCELKNNKEEYNNYIIKNDSKFKSKINIEIINYINGSYNDISNILNLFDKCIYLKKSYLSSNYNNNFIYQYKLGNNFKINTSINLIDYIILLDVYEMYDYMKNNDILIECNINNILNNNIFINNSKVIEYFKYMQKIEIGKLNINKNYVSNNFNECLSDCIKYKNYLGNEKLNNNDVLLNSIIYYCDNYEFIKYIFDSNFKNNNNVLHYIIHIINNSNESNEHIDTYINFINKYCDKEQIRKMIISENNDKLSPLNIMYMYSKQLINICEDITDNYNIVNYINSNGYSSIHYSVMAKNYKLIMWILKYEGYEYNYDFKFNILFVCRDINNKTAFELLIDQYKDPIIDDTIKELIFQILKLILNNITLDSNMYDIYESLNNELFNIKVDTLRNIGKKVKRYCDR